LSVKVSEVRLADYHSEWTFVDAFAMMFFRRQEANFQKLKKLGER